MNNYLLEIQKKLRSIILRKSKKDGFEKLSLFFSVTCVLFFILVLLEAAFHFSPVVRTILFFVFAASFTGSALFYFIIPFTKNYRYLKNPDYVLTAQKVGNQFPEIKDELANAIQLLSENNSGYSEPLINAAFESVYKKSEHINFDSTVTFSRAKKLSRICLATVFAVFLFVALIPGLSYSTYRLINYNKNFSAPPKFIFQITPGNKEVTKGDNVSIKIRVIGKQPDEINLSSRLEEQSEFVENKLLPDSLGLFSYEAISLKSSLEYFASAEGITSDAYKISVINRPVISSLDITIMPPVYSKLPIVNQRDNGNISVLPGSKIKITVDASRELHRATLEFSDSTTKAMNINGSSASLEFSATKEINYQIVINDKQNFSNANPILYFLKLLVDVPPTIELISPTEDLKLGSQTKVSLVSKISDDYGFSKLSLNYRLSTSKYRTPETKFSTLSIPISKETKEDEIYYTWDLSPLYLAEGEALVYYLEVFDNDIVNGPKSTRTKEMAIIIPSMDEIFQSAEKEQESSTKELAETFKEADKLQQEMKKISDDLKQNKRDINWQEKEKIEKAAEKFEKIGEKLNEVSQKLSDMQKDLMKNNLLSKETMEKYNELQNLMDQFNSEDLKNAFKKMQDALKGMMRENVQMSLEDLKANEEMIKNSIERTLNLLKRIQVEQKVDELVKRTENLTQKIDELKNKTENKNLNDSSSREELSQRQKDVSENLDQLNKEMQDLDKKMNDLKDMPKEMMDKIQKEFDKQNNDKLSDEAKKFLQQMQKQNAMQNQQKLSSNMGEMKQQLQQLQEQMQQMNQMKTFYEMVKTLDNLLTLSKDQEKLKNQTSKMNYQSSELSKAAQQQNELQSELSKILQNMNSLSQKSFAITPEMGSSIGKAFSEMQQAQTAMQNQNARLAENKQTGSMQYLNEAASMMKGAMDQMMNGSKGGSGMMGMMQQLQQMAQQQMQLNQMTQSMQNGQMSQQMMAQMQRLAQQQEMIRKSLEQLNQEAKETGQSKKIPANLDKVLDEMKEVVTNLHSEKVDDNLIKQQEKILSKLLDAQRSMNERDYEKDRKSNAGKTGARISPPELILSTEEGKNKLRDELQKAIREGYKKDYEDLIRKYFEALERSGK
jgi:hypothetical protein